MKDPTPEIQRVLSTDFVPSLTQFPLQTKRTNPSSLILGIPQHEVRRL